MVNKENNIKSRLKLLINNIDEFDSKFVTYKAESMKELLENTLEYIKDKEQEHEEEIEKMRRYHNKCCEEYIEKLAQWLEKYNQVSRDFYNGKYCNKENCSLLKAKEQECEELKGRLNTICFDPRANNNRCISYNRMAEDYEKDLKKINKYKQALDEIGKNIKQTCSQRCTNDCLGTRKHCGYGHILNIINKAKESK